MVLPRHGTQHVATSCEASVPIMNPKRAIPAHIIQHQRKVFAQYNIESSLSAWIQHMSNPQDDHANFVTTESNHCAW
jgi:hypothetical protein